MANGGSFASKPSKQLDNVWMRTVWCVIKRNSPALVHNLKLPTTITRKMYHLAHPGHVAQCSC
jgi:hypothetical protein